MFTVKFINALMLLPDNRCFLQYSLPSVGITNAGSALAETTDMYCMGERLC